MDSKFIKSHRCSLERSHAVFRLKLILNSDQDLTLSRQKQILTGLLTSDKNLQKQNNEDFFIQLLYACQDTSHQQQHPSPISIEEILVQPMSSNPHTKLNFKHHPTQEYFRKIYHYLGPLQISTIWSNFLYDILQETRFSYCQP